MWHLCHARRFRDYNKGYYYYYYHNTTSYVVDDVETRTQKLDLLGLLAQEVHNYYVLTRDAGVQVFQIRGGYKIRWYLEWLPGSLAVSLATNDHTILPSISEISFAPNFPIIPCSFRPVNVFAIVQNLIYSAKLILIYSCY